MRGIAAGEVGGASRHLDRNLRNPAEETRARLLRQHQPDIFGVFQRQRNRQQLFHVTHFRIKFSEKAERFRHFAEEQLEIQLPFRHRKIGDVMKHPAFEHLPHAHPFSGKSPQRGVGEIRFLEFVRIEEFRCRKRRQRRVHRPPQRAQPERFGVEVRRHHRQVHQQRRHSGGRIPPPLEKHRGVGQRRLEFLIVARSPFRRHPGFVEDAAQHAAKLFALVAQRPLDQHLHLDRPVGGAARRILRADVEHSRLKLPFDAAGADMRERTERPDDEDRITFPVHQRPLDGELDRRLDVAVDELPHRGGIERMNLLTGQPGVKRRVAGGVFPDADHDAAAFGVRQREAVADDLAFRLPGHLRPAERGLVVEHVGFHAAPDQLDEIVRRFFRPLLHSFIPGRRRRDRSGACSSRNWRPPLSADWSSSGG
ncbi:hypothetical protein SDC9_111460 [bioreactor metagenome]|uniref:Uncharacterized protein n=1 Tax=bioreactor metagenome TaxID=1076179 RepID=A0A645BMR2_9ZZZZ